MSRPAVLSLTSLALLGIAQRQIKAKRTPETGKTLIRKPLSDVPKTPGQALRLARVRVGISQGELAQMVGIPRWHLSLVETDHPEAKVEKSILAQAALQAFITTAQAGDQE